MFTSFFRVFTYAFQNMWRNFWLSLVTVSLLLMTLASINILLVVHLLTEHTIRLFEQRIEVAVYLQPNTTSDQVKQATGFFRSLQQVRDVEIRTPEEAVERFKKRYADNPSILNALTEVGSNPFGPVLILKAKSPEDFSFILTALENPQLKDMIREKDFSNYATLIHGIQQTSERIRTAGLILFALLLTIAVLIVFNMVRISLFIHREEIGIMKLVGATNRFIKAPYLIEAFIFSVIAVGGIMAITFATLAYLDPYLTEYFETPVNLLATYQQQWPVFFGVQFGGLCMLTLFSTGVAIRRYLKV